MKPWHTREIFALPPQPLLTREEFVKRYMPQYVQPYRPDYRIRTKVKMVDGRLQVKIPRTTAGTIKGQQTKRDNRINAEYAVYCASWNAFVANYNPSIVAQEIDAAKKRS